MAASAKKGFRMRAMTVLLSGEIVDDAGAKMTPTGLDVDGAYTAGDLRGWPNGTVVGSNGVVLYAGAPLTLTSEGTIALATPSIPTAAAAATPAAATPAAATPAATTPAAATPATATPAGASAPPPPKAAGSLSSPAAALTALITLALAPLMLM